MDIENKLKKLFDYQKFESNSRVNNIIEDSLEIGMMLSDEDLSMVNAAGNPYVHQVEKKG